MPAKKIPSTVKTLQAAKRVTVKRTAPKPVKVTDASKRLKDPSGKSSLDVLRLFIKTYENL